MGSNAGKDVQIRIDIPLYPDAASQSDQKCAGPWGGPLGKDEAAARAASVKKVLGALDVLLQAAQAAHRAGHLCDGADRLDYLERWYGELQAELRCLEKKD